MTALKIKEYADIELLIVNDSPDDIVEIPDIENIAIDIRVFNNSENQGIQKTRISGLREAKGDWIVFLDQDDELLPDGFIHSVNECVDGIDVIVGNLLYDDRGNKRKVYKNGKILKHAICLRRFLSIHNMIVSPGQCLIKKESIPSLWIDNPMNINGADDYYLWILMFKQSGVFKTVNECVYVHNDNGGENLSLNLEKMYQSCREMYDFLQNNYVLSDNELGKLGRCIDFKYFQDTGKLTVDRLVKYLDIIADNIMYKLLIGIDLICGD